MDKKGYTMGVFDLFHSGHADFLRKTSEKCKILYVGVCSDQLTLELKGTCPIFNQHERLNIISSIRYVDHAFIINDTDKLKIWNKYHYNLVFHGEIAAKYRIHEVISRNLLSPLDVEFLYFNREAGISTTHYINKIKNS